MLLLGFRSTSQETTGQCTTHAFFSSPCFSPLPRLTLTQTLISTFTYPQRMVVYQVEAVTDVHHLHPHITGKAPKTGAGVLNQRKGASGQQEAGPTQGTLTTVPSLNEMANGNAETTPLTNCGGHMSYQGCSGCPKGAPKDRCLFQFLTKCSQQLEKGMCHKSSPVEGKDQRSM